MFSKIKESLYKKAILSALKYPAPSSIPRTGEKAKTVNCNVIELYKDNEPYILVDKYNNGEVTGKAFDGDKYTTEQTISLKDASKCEIKIKHFYGVYEISFDSALDYLINKIFPSLKKKILSQKKN